MRKNGSTPYDNFLWNIRDFNPWLSALEAEVLTYRISRGLIFVTVLKEFLDMGESMSITVLKDYKEIGGVTFIKFLGLQRYGWGIGMF